MGEQAKHAKLYVFLLKSVLVFTHLLICVQTGLDASKFCYIC